MSGIKICTLSCKRKYIYSLSPTRCCVVKLPDAALPELFNFRVKCRAPFVTDLYVNGRRCAGHQCGATGPEQLRSIRLQCGSSVQLPHFQLYTFLLIIHLQHFGPFCASQSALSTHLGVREETFW